MKIAFLADSFLLDQSTGVNGTQVQMYNLASAFQRRGLEVHYISLTRDLKNAREIVNGITVHWLKRGDSIFSWMADIGGFQKILDQIRPDALYQRGRSHLTYMAAKWAGQNGKKFVWGSNGDDSCDFWKMFKLIHGSSRPWWKKLVLYPNMLPQDLLIHQGIRRARTVVNQSELQAARLKENYQKQGVVLPSYFLPPSAASGEIKENVVLWLANLRTGKQPHLFIKLAEHCRDLEEWKFVLAGGTDDRHYSQYLSEQARNTVNLELLGQVPFEETAEYFRRASLFVCTSNHEGLPNTYIQSWLNHNPILSLNIDPNGWISSYGLGFCAQGNLELFLEKGKYLLDHPAELREMGQRCADFAARTFAADETIDIYLKIFSTDLESVLKS